MEDVLYHYTSQDGLIGILDSKELWATNILYMNDSMELRYGVDLLFEQMEEMFPGDESFAFKTLILEFFNKMEPLRKVLIYSVSFSERNDLLSQWRGYSAGGGFSLGFGHDQIENIGGRYKLLRKCEYNVNVQKGILESLLISAKDKFEERAEDILSISMQINDQQGGDDFKVLFAEFLRHVVDIFAADFFILAPTLKHPKFEEEQEWRLLSIGHEGEGLEENIFLRQRKGLLIPYIKIPLKIEGKLLPVSVLTAGPSAYAQLNINSAAIFARSRGFEVERLNKSEIPYRD